MPVKKSTVFMLVVLAILASIGCAPKRLLPLGDAPGGPIIVIRTDPEPYLPKITTVHPCAEDDTPCWYAGWPSSADGNNRPDPVNKKFDEDPPRVPYYWNHDAGVVAIEVRLKSGRGPFYPSTIGLKLEHGWLGIAFAERGAVPVWSYPNDSYELKGKWLRKRANWPKVLLGKILDVKIVESHGTLIEPPVTLDEVQEITIHYVQ